MMPDREKKGYGDRYSKWSNVKKGDCLTITETIKAKGENLYDAVAERFNKGLGEW